MEAKVPQRIDMQDKVIGPLTIQQFFYLLFGLVAIYLLNAWTRDTILHILFYPLALVVAGLAIAMAFVKIQDRPFSFFVGALLRYLTRPRQRVWQKGSRPTLTKIVTKIEPKAEAPRKTLDRQRVTDIAKVLDQS